MHAHVVPPERSFSPAAEVKGYMIVAYLESAAAVSRTFADRLRKQLAVVGIDHQTSDEWYSAPTFQTALFATADSVDNKTLQQIGNQMATLSGVPDETDGPVAALRLLDTAHDRTHRNTDDRTTYELRDTDKQAGTAVVACPSMPYPEAVTHGAVVGVVDPHVTRVDIETLPPGDSRFRFSVDWT